MSTIRVNTDGTFETVGGRDVGVDPFLPEGEKELDFRDNPALQLQILALRLAAPSQGVIRKALGSGPAEWVNQVFGAPRQDLVTYDWRPTSVVANGARVWIGHKLWIENFTEPTFGSNRSFDRHAVIGAALLDERKLLQWATELLGHPIGQQALAAARRYWDPRCQIPTFSLQFATVDDVQRLPGAELTVTSHFLEDSGVVLSGYLRWSDQTWSFRITRPDFWEIELETSVSGTASLFWPPRLIARNGREEQRFAPPFTTLEALDTFAASHCDQSGFPVMMYSAELPALPRFVPPTPVQGEWATIWPSRQGWLAFAGKHNVTAEPVFNGLHGPTNTVLVPLTRKWAKQAWRAGAAQLPQVVATLPTAEEANRLPAGPYGENCRKVASGMLAGTRVFLGQSAPHVHLSQDFRGWLAAQGVQISYGFTVREAGDETADPTETVIFRNGKVRLPA